LVCHPRTLSETDDAATPAVVTASILARETTRTGKLSLS
jgi:hypothetical protein